MTRLVRTLGAAAFALVMSGCATMTVSSQVRAGVDFGRYRTYDWGAAETQPTGDPRLEKNPFFKDRLQGAVERQMSARGYVRSTSGKPDLLVHYHADITPRIDVNQVDRDNGYCYQDDCSVKVTEYDSGTLVLDIADARTKKVIWRGWAQDALGDMLENPDRMVRTIDEAVTRMLAKLPQRS